MNAVLVVHRLGLAMMCLWWTLVGLASPPAAAAAATVAATASAASAAASAGAAYIPYLADDGSAGPLAGRVLSALLACALVGLVLIQVLRGKGRLFGARNARWRELQVIETQALDGKARLILVRCGHDQLLLARSEHGVTLLMQRTLQARDGQP